MCRMRVQLMGDNVQLYRASNAIIQMRFLEVPFWS
jgi:hypothetical protein